ncbi:MAG: ATP-dependent zinc metalloprotease FtsH [Cyanobacteria bacterium P01_H01_bin.74]
MKKQQYTGFLILAGLVILALFVSSLFKQEPLVKDERLTYSVFIEKVNTQHIKSVDIVGNLALGHTTEVAVGNDSGKTASTTQGQSQKSDQKLDQNAALSRQEKSPLTPKESNALEAQSADAPSSGTKATDLKDEASGNAVLNSENVSTPTDGLTSKEILQQPEILIQYSTVLPEGGAGVDLLVPVLKKNNIPFNFKEPKEQGQWLGILTSIFLPLIMIIFFVMLFRSAQSGGSQALSFGKSRAKMSMDSKVKITFSDVAGIDEAKADLEEVVDFLKNGERYQKLGAKIPKGVLLVGAPGTGKTLLAKAVAGEAGVPFFSISGSDFVEMFVGVGASRVRDLFEQAKKHAPCIIFVDEIDAVGRQRGAGMGGGHDEREQTLNQLLVEMDGFDPHTGIIVVAATNRPDILDNALLRPGRFDRQVMIDRPDVQGREQILTVHAKGKPLDDNVDIKILAKRTPGFTGADLANLLNEGALLAARFHKEKIGMADIENSIDKVLAGAEKKNKIMSEKDKEITAYHEVGHALVAVMTEGSDPLRKVTIIPRGMALGITWTMPEDDKVHVTKSQMVARIAVALGGRAAEEIVFKDITSGASSDLQTVSSIARKMITTYGMSDKLGPITYGKRNEHMFLGRDFGTDRDYGEEVATIIDQEVKTVVDSQYQYVIALINSNRDIMDAIVKVLLEKETIESDEFMEIVDKVKTARSNGLGTGYTAVSTPAVPHQEDTANA